MVSKSKALGHPTELLKGALDRSSHILILSNPIGAKIKITQSQLTSTNKRQPVNVVVHFHQFNTSLSIVDFIRNNVIQVTTCRRNSNVIFRFYGRDTGQSSQGLLLK